MQVVIQCRLVGVVRAVHLVELGDAGLVHHSGVGQDGTHHVVLGELIVLGHLDAAQHVGDAGDTQPAHLLDVLIGHTQLVLHILLTLGGVEQAQQALAVLVVDGDGHIGVLHVVDPGDVLVADTLDAVAAEAVVQNGGALQCLTHGQLQVGIALLQQITGGHGAGGAGGEAGAGKVLTGLLHSLEQLGQRVAGDIVVPQGVAHLGELVEDHHGGIALQLPGLVEDLLDVGLAAGGGDDLTGDGLQPVKALLGHILGQDGHGLAGQQLGIEGAAAAVVAGGGPHGVVIGGVELAGHQTGGQAAEGCAHLMAAGGEPLAGHGDDAAGHAGQLAGDLHIVGDLLEQAAALLGLVVPGNAEQVDGVHVPQTGTAQLSLDLLGDQIGILHLCNGRDNDVVLLGLLDIVLQTYFVDGQIDHFFFSSCCLFASM